METNPLILLLLGACLALSFLLSGMESGVFALSRLRIRQQMRAGKSSARVLHQFLENPENFLWTIVVGNTLVNFVALGWFFSLGGRCLIPFTREVIGLCSQRLGENPAPFGLGLPLDRYALTVVVLVAALPSASNVALLAERFNADNGRIARIILLSTVLAFFTFSGAVALLV